MSPPRHRIPGYSKYGILDISDAFDYLKREEPERRLQPVLRDVRGPHAAVVRRGGRGVRSIHARPVSFEEAREKIEQNYALVVPMRRLDDAMAGIADAFGIDYTPIDHVNVATQKRAARVPDDVREQIIQGNSRRLQADRVSIHRCSRRGSPGCAPGWRLRPPCAQEKRQSKGPAHGARGARSYGWRASLARPQS